MPNAKPPNPSRPPASGGEDPRRLEFPMRVRRLRLRWSNNEWANLADITLDRKTLRQPGVLPSGPRRGFWYELRGASGELLFWNKTANPFTPSVELFESDGRIRREPIQREEAFIEVLIPDLPEAAQLQIFSDVTPDGELLDQATLIHDVNLGDDGDHDKDQQEDDHGRG